MAIGGEICRVISCDTRYPSRWVSPRLVSQDGPEVLVSLPHGALRIPIQLKSTSFAYTREQCSRNPTRSVPLPPVRSRQVSWPSSQQPRVAHALSRLARRATSSPRTTRRETVVSAMTPPNAALLPMRLGLVRRVAGASAKTVARRLETPSVSRLAVAIRRPTASQRMIPKFVI